MMHELVLHAASTSHHPHTLYTGLLLGLPLTFLTINIGQSIGFILEDMFQEAQGMRQDVAHVLVLITDGRAQDDVLPPSRMARALGTHAHEHTRTHVIIKNRKSLLFS